MGNTQLRGPQRAGSTVEDEGALTRAVVGRYAGSTRDEARGAGTAVASEILPLRRALWALAERLVPLRLAAALRARCGAADPTARDGVRELRVAIADWLDPPPRCRRCGRAIPQASTAEGTSRTCPATGPDGDAGVVRLLRAFRRNVRADRRAREMATRRRQGNLSGVVFGGGPFDQPPVDFSSGPAWAAPVHRRARTVRRQAHGQPCIPAQVGERARTRTRTARCGTLALHSAGAVSLEVMAAALACPKGAASGYDVAADRDCRALLVATRDTAGLLRLAGDPDRAWASEVAERLHLAVAGAVRAEVADRGRARSTDIHPALAEARVALQRARDRNLRTNGRLGLGVQSRYYSPDHGVTRADIVQGAAIGVDRAGLDFDAARGFQFSTYGAEWARQGCGAEFARRDLVDTPPWVLELRREVEGRLRALGGATAARDLLLAVEALAERPGRREALRLVRIVVRSEIHLPAMGRARPRTTRARPRTTRLPVHRIGVMPCGGWSLVREAMHLAAQPLAPAQRRWRKAARARVIGTRGIPRSRPWPVVDAENPERARERVAAWVASVGLGLAKVSGSGLLAALRHGCPVFVPVGSGADEDDSAGAAGGGGGRGEDSGGRTERLAVALEAVDPRKAAEEEADAAERWQRCLAALADLRADGAGGDEAAEVVRRHHGLDAAGVASAEDGGGSSSATHGESFQSIADSGLRCSGRAPCKEVVRRIYLRAMDALRRMMVGEAADLRLDDLQVRAAPSPVHATVRRSPVVLFTATPADVADIGAWSSFREDVATIAW